ncbi:MAG: xylulokinase [Firmicutes bacterium HGW-Firmicutes-16]|nr:MAG: xylulokinase [Firmicutes bacterium HGW-Firmicutes-16]
MAKYLIAHDIGTTGDKATLFTTDGELVRSVTYTYGTDYFNSTWAEQNPEDWWSAVCVNNKVLLKGYDTHQVAGMAFSGQMMGCVAVDKSGRPLRPAIIWADQRSQAQEAFIRTKIDEEKFYRITGHKISASYSLEKLMWIRDNEPDVFRKTYKMLQPKDYIIYRLTGEFVTDFSDASGTNCLDLNRLEWSDQILDMAGIDRDLLADVYPSTHVAGQITASVAEECGLAPGTPIVIGGGDGVCAAVGAGSVRSGDTFNYLGSSSWIALTSDEPIYDPQMRTYNWAHMVPGKYSPNGTMQAAGNSYQFVKKNLCKDLERLAEEQGCSSYALMNKEIEKSPVGANGLLYLPYILGERSPRWNSEARGAFIGLKMEHTRGDMLRACVEGVMMNLCIILDVFRKELDITDINVIGGLANGEVILHVLADVYGVRAKRLNWLDEATSMGAAVAAGVGVGVLEDFTAIDRFIRVDETVQSDVGNHKKYAELKGLFDESYYALLDTYKHLAQWH